MLLAQLRPQAGVGRLLEQPYRVRLPLPQELLLIAIFVVLAGQAETVEVVRRSVRGALWK